MDLLQRKLLTALIALASLSYPAAAAFASDDERGTVKVDGHTRTYELHRPATRQSQAKPLPLVIALHGRGGDGHGTAHLTHFNKVADAHAFMVVYPDGIDRSWADGRGVTTADKREIDDIRFISSLIEALSHKYPLDTHRVYATGISNGGFMTERLACQLSDRIAAAGVIAATLSQALASNCRPTRAVPIVFMQGSEDPLVPVQGGPMGRNGDRGVILSLQSTLKKFAELDACHAQPENSSLADRAGDGTSIDIQTYSGCRDNGEVIGYLIQGGGHTWPGGVQYLPNRMIGRTTHNLDASEALWQFFANYHLN